MSRCVGCALLLLCGLGLGLGVGVALPSRIGYCAGDLCYFQDSLDFKGARDVCENMLGQLFVFNSVEDLKMLENVLRSVKGEAWVRSGDKAAGERARICPAVSLRTERDPEVQWRNCHDKLRGFVCQYSAEGVCDGFTPAGGAPVLYSTTTGFRLDGSDSFPPGTVAETQQFEDKYPVSKNLCFYKNWLKAPWNCEVLTGGCAHKCSVDTGACWCPDKQVLHPNGFSCVREPSPEPECSPGFRLGPDGKHCVEANECAEHKRCEAGGGECVLTNGIFECLCEYGFVWEDGACVNVTICSLCEHMNCSKYDGVYRCVCREDFMVSPEDPTKCTWNCTTRDCPAICDRNQGQQCYCPDGYVADLRNDTVVCTDINECDGHICDHHCENLFGSYKCQCMDGFELRDKYRCVPLKYEDKEEGSGSESPTQSTATAAGLHPGALPQYIKTGSILGITVFMLLCVVLLALFTRNAVKRCGRFELSTFKHPDLDIYYLQQVSTETYKRLSFDRQLKNDPQRL